MTDHEDIARRQSILRGDMERDLAREAATYDDWVTKICKDCGQVMGRHMGRCSGETIKGYRWNPRLCRVVAWDEDTGRQRVVLAPTSSPWDRYVEDRCARYSSD